MARAPLQIGSIYESVGSWRLRWQLSEIVDSPGFPLHVRLSSLGTSKDVRLFASVVLNDTSRFRLVHQNETPIE
jgi:hypothetical protein